MGCSVRPWELAAVPERWGQWAIDYQRARADATTMRAQIEQVRGSKGQQQ